MRASWPRWGECIFTVNSASQKACLMMTSSGPCVRRSMKRGGAGTRRLFWGEMPSLNMSTLKGCSDSLLPFASLGRSYTEQKNHFAIGRKSERCSYHSHNLSDSRIPQIWAKSKKSCGNVRIWLKRAAVRRKNHSNLKKSFGMNVFWTKQNHNDGSAVRGATIRSSARWNGCFGVRGATIWNNVVFDLFKL